MCNDPLFTRDGNLRRAFDVCVDVMRSEGSISSTGAAEVIIDLAPGSDVRNIGRSPQDRTRIFERAIGKLKARKVFRLDATTGNLVPGTKMPGHKAEHANPDCTVTFKSAAPTHQPDTGATAARAKMFASTVWFQDHVGARA